MIQRCTNQNEEHYDRYGGRGITVCSRWLNSFKAFWEDMGDPPPKMTLDRIDNSLGYSKSNCRWATRWEQSVNREDNVKLTIGGVTKSVASWAKEKGLDYSLVYYRKHTGGWADEDCLKPEKLKQPAIIRFNGKDYTPKEIAALTGISITSVHLRIKAGWSTEEIITRPNSQPYKRPGWKFTPPPTVQVDQLNHGQP